MKKKTEIFNMLLQQVLSVSLVIVYFVRQSGAPQGRLRGRGQDHRAHSQPGTRPRAHD